MFLSFLFGGGAMAFALHATHYDWSTSLLTGWDAGVVLYLVLVVMLIAGADVERIRRQSARLDDGRIAILVLITAAALASLGAIVNEVVTPRGSTPDPVKLGMAVLTIALSWSFIHTMFALHYAHEFYAEHRGAGGLKFPEKEPPDYWDFVYFSFVIGMTSQVSDVTITSKAIRKTVTAHSIVSFAFNVALLALTINIAASAFSGTPQGFAK